MGNGNQFSQEKPNRPKVSVLVLERGSGWAAEVAIRCNGQLKAYWRDEESLYPSHDQARTAGYRWADDYLRAQEAPAGPAEG